MNYFYENRIPFMEDYLPMSIYHNKSFSFLAHWHSDVELLYVQEGSIYVGVNNERKLVTEGDLVICCSGDIHYYESCDFLNKCILLVFKPELIGFPAYWPGDRSFLSPFISKEQIATTGLAKISDLLLCILAEKEQKNTFYESFIKAYLIELCSRLLRYIPYCEVEKKRNYISSPKLVKMQKILSYIEDHYTDELSLEGLSELFNIDIFNLSKMFNSITGKNYKTYLNTIRIIHAEDLILNSKNTLTDIALECGFNSIRTFNRVFKSIKGRVPSNLR